MWRLSFLLLGLTIQNGGAAKIFSLYSVPSKSHRLVFLALTESLSPQHEQVVATVDPETHPPANVTQIDIHDKPYELFHKVMYDIEQLRRSGGLFLQARFYSMLQETATKYTDAEYKITNVNEMGKEKFDLVIIEGLSMPSFALGQVLEAPLIAVGSMTTLCMVFDAIGVPTHPMLYYDFARTRLETTDMWDRIVAAIETVAYRYIDWTYVEKYDAVIRNNFGNKSVGALESAQRTDMLLLNIKPVWEGIRPIPPALVFVGGLHFKPAKPLDEEMQKFLDSATRGVIYMSLGSNVRSADLSQEKIQIFLQVFSQLPYDVLWKWEEDELPGKSDNIHIAKWWPQPSLLNHPNVKAFITHAGLHSIEEAIEARVPLVAIPFFADQLLNSQRVVGHGVGVALDLHTLTEMDLMEALTKVTVNDTYRHSMERMAALFNDEPDSPALRVRWWAEYVLRHGGAGHLRAPAAGVSLATYLMLDVLAVVTVALLALVTAAFVLIRQLTRLILVNVSKSPILGKKNV